MNYRHFDEIDLPNLTVTEANPAHALDFMRYSSDEIKSFNLNRLKLSVPPALNVRSAIIIGMFNQFDHRLWRTTLISPRGIVTLGDVAEYASGCPQRHAIGTRLSRTGIPTSKPSTRSLSRDGTALGDGKQLPALSIGPGITIPAPGAVRMWSWEAHGAEVVSYFRWRQSPSPKNNARRLELREYDALVGGMKQFNGEINSLDIPQNAQALLR